MTRNYEISKIGNSLAQISELNNLSKGQLETIANLILSNDEHSNQKNNNEYKYIKRVLNDLIGYIDLRIEETAND